MQKNRQTLLIILIALLPCPGLAAPSLDIYTATDLEQVRLVAREMQATLGGPIELKGIESLEQSRASVSVVLFVANDSRTMERLQAAGAEVPSGIQPEGFSIRKTRQGDKVTVWLAAADAAGLLYGGYEIAEQIRTYGLDGVRERDQNPYMAMRGIKLNIPLDVRTPSYSHASDAAQHNIAEMWSFDFWKQYIESLARHRYNFISAWSLHPFPSLVRVPGYEDIALDDVQRSTVHWREHYSLEAVGLDTPEILDNVEVLKKISIDEKIAFWKKVMAYARLHNIDFYFITWNIFTNGTEGKYGITNEPDNPVTRDYFRQSVKAMFTTYPDLKGIGLTTGENMLGLPLDEKEDWAYDTYGLGVLDAAKEQPGRKITFIHRQHWAGAIEIADKFRNVIDHPDIEFIYSFKYAQSHVYSSTEQPFHRQFVEDIRGENDLKTIWTLRNDDIYHFRWGSPDYVREFLRNIPYDVSRGYYYGSDNYIWGRDFLSLDPENPQQTDIDKHWYHWMLWGRLGYDPDLSNDRFVSILRERYKGVDAARLFEAWQEASMIYPVTTGFHWGPNDFFWYIEASQGRPLISKTPTGFHDVNRFISMRPHPGTDNISIPDYVEAITAGTELKGTTPLMVASQLHSHADRAVDLLKEQDYTGDQEIRLVLDDIRTMAWLGKHYAHKIEAATQLAMFRATLDPEERESSIRNLNAAAAYWRSYASLALSNNRNPLWTNRVGHADWRKSFIGTVQDARSTGGSLRLPHMPPSAGGTILEAEDANYDTQETNDVITGFTGSGYVVVSRNNRTPDITWTYDAPAAGRYIIEVRYTNPWDRPYDCTVSINGSAAGTLRLWESGASKNWVWDRILVDLPAGTNEIRIQGDGRFNIDHLNIIPTHEGL